ncbi:MAG: tRNA (adenosine(37)-N6)-threonylcarbamoyltransferase complex dimerization subunit type 1 TsaB [Sphingobacteriales bacterium]|jgi:tRNA threonylcarbamoyladenosine biosynthesis protein TsaB|nr:tRNA (adenosine(37)-N6)-threonylcarbamoyltransferase complex dimerization subunit type 1 TsaB [Sphingobacteriales bacterium]
MALILNIETAIDSASFCVADDGRSVFSGMNESRTGQAAWLHRAIKEAFENNSLTIKDIDAVSVSNGPGSYTGLRVGLSTAKGICYALKMPLICINTLEIMALSVTDKATDLICPMIDARRMEVFAAVYDKTLNIVHPPEAMVLTEADFDRFLSSRKVLFTGNGAGKFRNLINNPNADFVEDNISAVEMAPLSEKYFTNNDFSDLAYAEPYYLKPVYLHN